MLNSNPMMDYLMNRRVQTRRGNRNDRMAPHNCYPCRGEHSWISIAIEGDDQWRALCSTARRTERLSPAW